jgi:L-fuculose-phosphate aldolase
MQDIIKACQKLYARGLVANHDGNITFKVSGGFIATPTSFSKGDVTASDLLRLDENGKVVEGKHKVFSEIALHLEIYKVRPEIKCVVHAHPSTASAFGIAGKEIGVPGIPEAIVSLGRNILNTMSPTREEFARVLAETDAFIIPGNGAWAVGQDVMQTYYRMELVEHIAQQHFKAEQLGGVNRVAPEVVSELLKKRPKIIPSVDNSNLRDLVREEISALFNPLK